jgi:ribosome-associated protein
MTDIKKRNKTEEITSTELCQWVVKGMQEKKAIDIVVMDLRNIKTAVADFFIVCSGNTETQVDAISASVDEEVFKGTDVNPWRVEGKTQKEWILTDYVDVVAHVFKNDRREFYKLEDLWGDAEFTYISE